MAIQDFHFVPGELYLFSSRSPHHDPDRCLWGIFDKLENGNVVLEVHDRRIDPILQGRLRPSRSTYPSGGRPATNSKISISVTGTGAGEPENKIFGRYSASSNISSIDRRFGQEFASYAFYS